MIYGTWRSFLKTQAERHSRTIEILVSTSNLLAPISVYKWPTLQPFCGSYLLKKLSYLMRIILNAIGGGGTR